MLLTDILQQHLGRYQGNTLRNWQTFAGAIRNYEAAVGAALETDLSSDDFLSLRFALEQQGYSANTICNFTDKLKTVLNAAQRKGFNVSDEVASFSAIPEETAPVALTEAEVKRVAGLKLEGLQALVRDRFIIGCVTGLRFADFNRVTGEHIGKTGINMTTGKTKSRVVIPVHPLAAAIFIRYGADFPAGPTNTTYNNHLPAICARARIADSSTIERRHKGEILTETFKKYQLVTTHTARRTAATNMYLASVPVARIMMITGHKTETAFFKYIRIAKEENAGILSQHPYFL